MDGYSVSSGPPRSRCQERVNCTRNMSGEISVKDKGEGTGKAGGWCKCDTCERRSRGRVCQGELHSPEKGLPRLMGSQPLGRGCPPHSSHVGQERPGSGAPPMLSQWWGRAAGRKRDRNTNTDVDPKGWQPEASRQLSPVE